MVVPLNGLEVRYQFMVLPGGAFSSSLYYISIKTTCKRILFASVHTDLVTNKYAKIELNNCT